MSLEHKVSIKTTGALIRCISGLFITKEYPNGLTPVEMGILTSLIEVLNKQNKTEIDKEVKTELANSSNQSLQVCLNYITKFRKKGLVKGNSLHPIFYKERIIIERTTNE